MQPEPASDVYRFEYSIELTCSLCARTVATLRARTPRARVLLPRQPRCQVCGGTAVISMPCSCASPCPSRNGGG
jgi:hypothetical protein